jgi:uncharacterized membrane protein
MELILKLLSGTSEIVDIIGIAVLLYVFIRVFIKYLLAEVKSASHAPIRLLQSIRCEIGIYILLALDFIIASDIIHTVTELTQKQLMELRVLLQ